MVKACKDLIYTIPIRLSYTDCILLCESICISLFRIEFILDFLVAVVGCIRVCVCVCVCVCMFDDLVLSCFFTIISYLVISACCFFHVFFKMCILPCHIVSYLANG